MIPTALPGGAGGGTGGAPSGAAGGDLTGTYPAPGVGKVGGVAVTGTPSAGYSPRATSGVASSWQKTPVKLFTPDTGKTIQPAINTATTLLANAPWAIAAGEAAIGDIYEIDSAGYISNTSGSNTTPSFGLVTLGSLATLIASTNAKASTAGGVAYQYRFRARIEIIGASGAAGNVLVDQEFFCGSAAALGAFPAIIAASSWSGSVFLSSVAWASAWTIDFQGQYTFANAGVSLTSLGTTLKKFVV